MKKAAANRKSKAEGNLPDLRREYRFDYRKARPNRFTRQMQHTTVTVTLDPDVATVFQTSKSVNSLLRSVISAFPGRRKSRSRQMAVLRELNQRSE
jgi:hypothetical protein